jgi:hypothetical protein
MNLSKIAQVLGRKGGKQSAKSRFMDKSKAEISEMMRGVRKTKFTKSDDLVDCLNSAVLKQNR